MRAFETKTLGAAPDAVAPDGTAVRLLAALSGGSFAHFELPAGAVSHAIVHRTVEEIWWFVAGRGELWRQTSEHEEVVAVGPGVSATIPLGTRFQFRAAAEAPLAFVAVTMPPWPGEGEAAIVEGKWRPTVGSGDALAPLRP
jgi:mannose-6-phosphate isomerase-like protein (cupin superfamily)